MGELCQICGEMTSDPHHHHVIPRSKGGKSMGTIVCCPTCSGQLHMLFTNKELAAISVEELINTEEIKKYIKWKKKHRGDFKHRQSKKVKKWFEGHRA